MAHVEDDRRTEPARVYPAPDGWGCWVVEAPADAPAPARRFSGDAAQRRAVQFAFEAFGGARMFLR